MSSTQLKHINSGDNVVYRKKIYDPFLRLGRNQEEQTTTPKRGIQMEGVFSYLSVFYARGAAIQTTKDI